MSRAFPALLAILFLSGANALKFSFNEIQAIKCDFPSKVREFLHNDPLQKRITQNWVKTHEIDDWHSTRSILVSDAAKYPEIDKYKIPSKGKHDHLFYMYTSYISYVQIPKILKTVMNTKIKTNTHRKSFVTSNREYKVVHITGIPLIGFITVFSKSVYMSDGSVFTSHAVETGEIPFWALWSQNLVKKIIRGSATDFQKQLTIDYCRSK